MPFAYLRIARLPLCLLSFLGAVPLYAAGTSPAASAGALVHQAQIEVRISCPPSVVLGSDGERHLAYEMRITSFQDEDNPLTLTQLALFADSAKTPLEVVRGSALNGLTNISGNEDNESGVPIVSGKSLTLFLWVTLPTGVLPRSLRHQLILRARNGDIQRADTIITPIARTGAIHVAPPLRGGRWLAVEGPGNHQSHHWGSVVAINGALTIPQRFAIDWFKLDPSNHSIRGRHDSPASTGDEDWVGYDQDVLAVADGVVVDSRDGVPNGKPLAPQETPADLTTRTLYGNFVVLKIAPGVYAHYAHLKDGTVKVRIGQYVRKGATIGRLGQTGAAGAPHLHFHLSDRSTFEGSEGLPFVIDAFAHLGKTKIEATFDATSASKLRASRENKARDALPLDGDVVIFR